MENQMKQPEAPLSYRVEELWCQNEGRRIYGQAYIPEGAGPHPLVIYAHELGYSHAMGIPYARRLATAGFAVYLFDFCGGSIPSVENRSDGRLEDMTFHSEMGDLLAVLQAARTWSFVDPERILCLGASQGGGAAALAVGQEPELLAGLMLLYPAFSASDDVRAKFSSPDVIPERFHMFGHWIELGRQYGVELWDMDFCRSLARYPRPFLLLHGDQDEIVDVSYARRAAELCPLCQLHILHGAGHIFTGEAQEEAIRWILDYLEPFRDPAP